MNVRTVLFPLPPPTPASAGLLLLRVFAGLSMASHGWGKIQNPFHWMDQAPSAPPAFFQFLAAVAEFFGGLGIAVGLVSVIAAFGIVCTMVVAMQHHIAAGDPFSNWELAGLYFCISVVVLLAGPGRFSLDAVIRSRIVGPS